MAEDKKFKKPRRRDKAEKLWARSRVEQMTAEELAKLNEELEAEIIAAIDDINSYPEKADFGL
ncbi:MAG: hypothetical protein Q4P65_01205 [Eubacteriales bacterium]|nr:hypothetical protein [Eubacteriales bacterium]